MLILAGVMALVILVGYYSFWFSLMWAAFCIILLFIINYKKQSGVLIFCGVLLLASMLSTSFCMGEVDRLSKFDDMTVTGEFIVVKASENNGTEYACEIEVIESKLLKSGDKINAFYNGAEIPLGQSFKAEAQLYSFDESVIATSYYSQNVYISANLSNIVLTDNKDYVLNIVDGLRNYIKNEIYKYLEDDQAATALALLTGDRSYMSDELYSDLKGAGVMHAMVVSGMHLSIIVTFMLWAVNKFFYNRFLKGAIIFLTVLAVAAICGFTMSILRAGITYVLYALALLISREPRADNCLGTAVCIILITNPFALFNVAFLLSVLSTFGVLCVALPIIKFIKEKRIIKQKWLIAVISAMLISLSAMLLTLPIMISTFGYVSNMTVISNFLVSFPITVVISLCLVGFIFFPLKGVVFYLAGLVIKYINSVVHALGGVEFATTELPEFASYIVIFVIVLILFVMITCGNRNLMLKLKGVLNKKIKEGGGRLKWQSFTKKR